MRGVEKRNIRTFLFTFETFEIVVSGAGNVDCRHTVAFLVERRIAVDCVVHRCDVQMLVTDVDLATIGAVVVCERHDVFRHALFIEASVLFVTLCNGDDFDVVACFLKVFHNIDAGVVSNDKSRRDYVAALKAIGFKRVLIGFRLQKEGFYNIGVDINLVNLFFHKVGFVESVKLRPCERCLVVRFDLVVVYFVKGVENTLCQIEFGIVDELVIFICKSIALDVRRADEFVCFKHHICENKAFNRACTLKRIVVDIFEVFVEFYGFDRVRILIERFFAD